MPQQQLQHNTIVYIAFNIPFFGRLLITSLFIKFPRFLRICEFFSMHKTKSIWLNKWICSPLASFSLLFITSADWPNHIVIWFSPISFLLCCNIYLLFLLLYFSHRWSGSFVLRSDFVVIPMDCHIQIRGLWNSKKRFSYARLIGSPINDYKFLKQSLAITGAMAWSDLWWFN